MAYISLEKLTTEEKPSLFKLVLAAASRGNEIAKGVKPLVETESKKVTTVSLEEIAAGKVTYEIEDEKKSKK